MYTILSTACQNIIELYKKVPSPGSGLLPVWVPQTGRHRLAKKKTRPVQSINHVFHVIQHSHPNRRHQRPRRSSAEYLNSFSCRRYTQGTCTLQQSPGYGFHRTRQLLRPVFPYLPSGSANVHLMARMGGLFSTLIYYHVFAIMFDLAFCIHVWKLSYTHLDLSRFLARPRSLRDFRLFNHISDNLFDTLPFGVFCEAMLVREFLDWVTN